jgi:hypothetical protein
VDPTEPSFSKIKRRLRSLACRSVGRRRSATQSVLDALTASDADAFLSRGLQALQLCTRRILKVQLRRFGSKDLELGKHFLVFGETVGLLLVPDLFVVHMHVEDAAGALDQLGFDTELLFDRFRQTGGSWEVVSLRAVFDGDVHWFLSGDKTRLKTDDRRLKVEEPAALGASKQVPLPSVFALPSSVFILLSSAYARFIVIKNSALVRHLPSWERSNSMASTTFMSDSTRRRR